MILRLNTDEDNGIVRRHEDYSDSISVYYPPEANYTSTVAYSIKLQLTRETTPGFLRELHLTRGAYNVLHVLFIKQRGYAFKRPTLDAYSTMKEYYDAYFF